MKTIRAFLVGMLLLVTRSNGLDAEALPTLPDVSGQDCSLQAALAPGKSVVLVFWAEWCAPCAREAPKLVEAADALKGKATFFGVVSGKDRLVNDRRVSAFIKKHQLNYPTLRDRQSLLAKRFHVEATPTIIVLDANGKVRYTGHRAPRDWNPIL